MGWKFGGSCICDMLSISESQMVVFFYISVKYSEIYKRKVMREN